MRDGGSMTGSAKQAPAVRRVLGRYRGRDAGPTLLCLSGVHGNEPAGVEALLRVFRTLETRRPAARGEFVGLAGNLPALARGRRFIETDLNRAWSERRLIELRTRDRDRLEGEDRELVELADAIDDAIEAARGEVYFIDLHTTSSRSAPFAVINDTRRNRAFAEPFGVPIILGLEEFVEGTVADHAHQLGCVTMGFEAGRHDDPAAVDYHEAVVWMALAAAGIVEAPDGTRVEARRRTLATAADGVPRYQEIIARHHVTSRAEFEMLPGFENFQPVPAGLLLARDHRSDVTASRKARVFMPLYQDSGNDGFFLTRPVNPFWLRLSSVLRSLNLPRIVPWLPGISRHPTEPGAVIVHPRVARWLVRESLHLLGYRRRPSDEAMPVYRRRRHDV